MRSHRASSWWLLFNNEENSSTTSSNYLFTQGPLAARETDCAFSSHVCFEVVRFIFIACLKCTQTLHDSSRLCRRHHRRECWLTKTHIFQCQTVACKTALDYQHLTIASWQHNDSKPTLSLACSFKLIARAWLSCARMPRCCSPILTQPLLTWNMDLSLSCRYCHKMC